MYLPAGAVVGLLVLAGYRWFGSRAVCHWSRRVGLGLVTIAAITITVTSWRSGRITWPKIRKSRGGQQPRLGPAAAGKNSPGECAFCARRCTRAGYVTARL